MIKTLSKCIATPWYLPRYNNNPIIVWYSNKKQMIKTLLKMIVTPRYLPRYNNDPLKVWYSNIEIDDQDIVKMYCNTLVPT